MRLADAVSTACCATAVACSAASTANALGGAAQPRDADSAWRWIGRQRPSPSIIWQKMCALRRAGTHFPLAAPPLQHVIYGVHIRR